MSADAAKTPPLRMSMQLSRLLRSLMAVGVILLFFIGLVLILYLTQMVFEVWDHLKQSPGLLIFYGIAILGFSAATGWWVWRLLRPPAKKPPAAPTPVAPPTEEELEARVKKAREAGIDVAQITRELQRLRERRAAGFIHVSLFGEISSGKSSLINALLPQARVEVSARGGTTRTIDEYHWATEAGDELVLADVPGTNEVGEVLDDLARTEAQRAHIVIYVCDGDLSRSQFDELKGLLELEKPCILALNKTDRYSQAELEMLKTRLRDRLAHYPRTDLVGVRAGGEREVLCVQADGSEQLQVRMMPPQVDELQLALQRRIDDDPQLLERLRDSAVFTLVSRRLGEAEARHRRQKADEVVKSYARKAVIGAMAAVTPGSDLIIQGYLGVRLIQTLSELYEVPVGKADRDKLLSLVQKQVGKTTTLALAVAGNALKAFPGIGTLAGGLMHAVAYGLVFQSLGRAVAQSFESRGELHPVQTARTFKENLGEDLEISARDFAEMAIQLAREKHSRKDTA
jgi:small GTP-binding protein